MENKTPPGVKVDRQLEAEPLTVGGWRIQPVARLVGWEMDGSEQTGPFMSRVGRVTPLEVRIDSEDRHSVLTLDDPLQEPVRAIVAAGAVTSAVCLAIMVVARLLARRR